MNGGNDKLKCNFCMNNMIVPSVSAHKLIDKSQRLYRKNNNMLSFRKIVQFVKMSREIEVYLGEKDPNLLDRLEDEKFSKQSPVRTEVLKRDFLNGHPSAIKSTGISCDKCNREACDFHINFGGFIFSKYSCCHRGKSLCGWCRDSNKEGSEDEACIECSKTCIKGTTSIVDTNKSTKDVMKNRLTLLPIPEDTIINFKRSEPIDIKCVTNRLTINKDQLLKTVSIKLRL